MIKSNRKRTNTVVRIVSDDGTERTRNVATSDPLVAIRAAYREEQREERKARAQGKGAGR